MKSVPENIQPSPELFRQCPWGTERPCRPELPSGRCRRSAAAAAQADGKGPVIQSLTMLPASASVRSTPHARCRRDARYILRYKVAQD